jgi:hypothetical protein
LTKAVIKGGTVGYREATRLYESTTRGLGEIVTEAFDELAGDAAKETIEEAGADLAKEAVEEVGANLVKEAL